MPIIVLSAPSLVQHLLAASEQSLLAAVHNCRDAYLQKCIVFSAQSHREKKRERFKQVKPLPSHAPRADCHAVIAAARTLAITTLLQTRQNAPKRTNITAPVSAGVVLTHPLRLKKAIKYRKKTEKSKKRLAFSVKMRQTLEKRGPHTRAAPTPD